jgi:dihydroorotase
MRLLIKGGRVIDPANDLDQIMDLLIEDGFISRIGINIDQNEVEVIEAQDMLVCPGFIDMHVHLRGINPLSAALFEFLRH